MTASEDAEVGEDVKITQKLLIQWHSAMLQCAPGQQNVKPEAFRVSSPNRLHHSEGRWKAAFKLSSSISSSDYLFFNWKPSQWANLKQIWRISISNRKWCNLIVKGRKLLWNEFKLVPQLASVEINSHKNSNFYQRSKNEAREHHASAWVEMEQ